MAVDATNEISCLSCFEKVLCASACFFGVDFKAILQHDWCFYCEKGVVLENGICDVRPSTNSKNLLQEETLAKTYGINLLWRGDAADWVENQAEFPFIAKLDAGDEDGLVQIGSDFQEVQYYYFVYGENKDGFVAWPGRGGNITTCVSRVQMKEAISIAAIKKTTLHDPLRPIFELHKIASQKCLAGEDFERMRYFAAQLVCRKEEGVANRSIPHDKSPLLRRFKYISNGRSAYRLLLRSADDVEIAQNVKSWNSVCAEWDNAMVSLVKWYITGNSRALERTADYILTACCIEEEIATECSEARNA